MSKIPNHQKILTAIYESICQEENKGEVANYIPELAKINPDKFGVYFSSVENEYFGIITRTEVMNLGLAFKIHFI